jgi:hypothetical protein
MVRIIINLGDYCQDGNYDFASTTKGVAVRNASGLDKHISSDTSVQIVIPKQIFSLGLPFLQEFLENAIMHCDGNLQQFHELVQFKSEGRYDIKFDLAKVIENVLEAEYQ